MTRDHERYEENVGAYLLGALTELEAEVFERHLVTCAACRQEFDQLRVAAEALPRSVDPVAPSPALKQSLMQAVWDDAQGAGSRARADHGADTKPERRSRRRMRLLPKPLEIPPAVAWVSAAFLLAVGIATGWGVTHLTGTSGESTVTATVDHRVLPEGSGHLELRSDPGKGATLTVQGMPSPGANQVYEVWLHRGNEYIPSGAFFSVGKDGSGTAAIARDLDGVDSIAVTREAEGGAPHPTGAPPFTVGIS